MDSAPDGIEIWPGKAYPLGATYDGSGTNFALFSEIAESVELCLFDEDGNETTTTYRRFKNGRLLDMDLEGALLQALERINPETGQIGKSAFLLGRTLKLPLQPKIESTRDAMFVSLDQRGTLDLPHVAELAGKPVDEVITELGNAIFEVPGRGYQTADEYLSGDVVTKLEEAEAAAAADPRYERNRDALREVQPAPLTAEQINVELGAGWLDPEVIQRFAEEVIGLPLKVSYQREIGKWSLDYQYRPIASDGSKMREFSADAMGPQEILQHVVNARAIKIMTRGSKSEPARFDPVATEGVNVIAEKMREAFANWIWTDGPRAARLLEVYNRNFNNIAPRQFDGSHLTLPGLSLKFPLHPHQKRAVWRIIQSGNTYLAHAVGAGKTLEMIVAAMEQRRLGLIRKPMFVVPNHMLNQFASEFLEAYPAAKVLVADDKAFHTTRRQRFMAQAALNDLDGIIITHSAFGLLSTRPQTRKAIVDRMIADLQAAIDDLGKGQDTRITRQRLQQQIERIERKFAGKTAEDKKDQGLMFEDMGVDFINVDEAHEFRKLDYSTDRQIKGIDPNGSARALDLFIKTRWLESQRPGRSMVFASGTPVTNTIAELYSIMRFMDEDALEADGLRSFDAWATAFARAKAMQEQNAAGGYELVTRFSKFVNVPEMMKRVTKFADILTTPQLGHLVRRPTIIGGGPESDIVTPSPSVLRYMQDVLLPRIEQSRAWKPSQSQPHNPDPMVRIITDGRLSAIDLRFVDKNATDDPSSKLNRMVDRIIEAHKAHAGDEYVDPITGKKDPIKGSAQIVFSPVGFGEGVALSRGFDARGFIMKRLAAAGIKASEVAWMGDYTTDAKKQAMFKEVRAGSKRILFGSPKNMGTGLNVQKRLKILHYLSPPWYPADVEQPHGRILRQGNQNSEVQLVWYATKGTYDSTGWGMVARKAFFIEEAFSGNDTVRELDDVSEAGQYEMAAALAAGDERAIKLANLNNEIGRLELQQQAHHRDRISMRSRRDRLQELVSMRRRSLIDMRDARALAPEIETLEVKVGDQTFGKPGEAGKEMYAILQNQGGAWEQQQTGESKLIKLGTVNGHQMQAVVRMLNGAKAYQLELVIGQGQPSRIGNEQWLNEISQRSPSQPITEAVRMVNELPENIERVERSLTEGLQELEEIKVKLDKPFPQAQALASKVAEAAQLRAELAAAGVPAEAGGSAAMPVAEEIEADTPAAVTFTSADFQGDKPKLQLVPSNPIEDANTLGRTIVSGNLSDPEWVKIRKAIEADLALVTRQLAGSGVQVKAFDLLRAAGQTQGFVAGTQLKNLVTVSLFDGDGHLRSHADLLGTVRHEVIHFLKAAGVIPRGSWAALEKSAKTWRQTFNIDELYADQNLSEAELNEEAIAEAYNHFGKGQLKLDPPRATGMRAIHRFMTAIRDLVRRALGMTRIPTPGEIFQAIERGDFAASNPTVGEDTNLKTQLPGAAAGLAFSPTDIKANIEQLEAVNYNLLQRAMRPGMRGNFGHLVDHARRIFQDRQIRTRRVEEGVEAALGAPLPETAQPYLHETLYYGKTGEAKFRLDQDFFKPIIKRIHDAGLSLAQVDRYLMVRHAEERNDYIASINPRQPDGGSGIDTADARRELAAMANLPPDQWSGLQDVAALVDQMLAQRIDRMEASGLITPALAQTWRTQYKHYVPLRGKAGTPAEDIVLPKIGRGFMGLSRLEPTAHGRGSGNEAQNILATAMTLADEAIVRAQKNEVQVALLNLAQMAPDPNVWKIDPVERKAYMASVRNPGTNTWRKEVRYRYMPHNDRTDTVIVRVAGQPFRLQIKDEYLLRAISNVGAAELGPITAHLARFTGFLSKLNTMYSPEFLISNAFMDFQAGVVNLNQEQVAKLKRTVIANWNNARKGAYQYVRTGQATSTWGKWAKEFREAGGATAFFGFSDAVSEGEKLERHLRLLTSGKSNAIRRGLRSAGEVIEAANTSIDNAIRLSTYVALREANYTPAQAARVAKNLTINFNRKGEMGPVLNAWFMFFNAATQGTFVLAKAMRHKGVRRFVYTAFAAGVLQEMLSGAWEPPDDDEDGLGLSSYDRIPEWEKQTNMIFTYGPNPGDYFKIRMPYGYGFFHSLGRQTAAYLRGAKTLVGTPISLGQTIANMGTSFVSNMIPPGLADLGVPTIAAPFVQIAKNEDWTGRPIMPTKYPGEDKPDSQLKFPSSNPGFNWLAEQLNWLTDGSEFRSGLIDVSPESISHVLNVYAGAAGAMAWKVYSNISRGTAQAMGWSAEDPGWNANDIPMARRVLGSSAPWQARDATYQRLAEIEILADEAKGNTAAAQAVRSTHRREIALLSEARKTRKAMGAMSKERRAILANDKLSVPEQRRRLEVLGKREKSLMLHWNARYMRAVSSRPE